MYLTELYQHRRFQRSVNETQLLHEGRTEYPHLTYATLSSDSLARIARDRGIDFATALFYDRIRRSPEHGPFITEVEALEPDIHTLPRLAGKILIAPSAYYREHPELNRTTRPWHSAQKSPRAARGPPLLKGAVLFPPLAKGGEGGFLTCGYEVCHCHVD
jgi:hypothetical protein